MKDYVVVSEHILSDFESVVTDLLNDGYELAGNMQVVKTDDCKLFYQAMIKDLPKEYVKPIIDDDGLYSDDDMIIK